MPGRVLGKRRQRALRRLAPLMGLLLAFGCGRTGGELVVATSWPDSALSIIAKDLAAGPRPTRVRWVRMAEPDDPTRSAEQEGAVDVVLGGPPSRHARLALRGRLQPIVSGDERPWRFVHRPGVESPSEESEDYAAVVRAAAEGRPGLTITEEAVSLVAESPRRDAMGALLSVIGGSRPAPPSASLEADLLASATLDGQPELLAARSALAKAGDPSRPLTWMTESPPWPPASIARMRAKPDGDALVDTLAEQVAPDPSARSWLLRSFDRPTKPIDPAFLHELDAAAGGRLAADPRFRSWVRSEWAAWSRQRYRRVARNPDGARFAAP